METKFLENSFSCPYHLVYSAPNKALPHTPPSQHGSRLAWSVPCCPQGRVHFSGLRALGSDSLTTRPPRGHLQGRMFVWLHVIFAFLLTTFNTNDQHLTFWKLHPTRIPSFSGSVRRTGGSNSVPASWVPVRVRMTRVQHGMCWHKAQLQASPSVARPPHVPEALGQGTHLQMPASLGSPTAAGV